MTANPDVLWPPNHKMVPVTVRVEGTDDSGGPVTCRIISVSSNERVNGQNANTAPDWEITGPLTVDLRAERSCSGRGRLYTITVECQDAVGNAARSTVDVTVPKSQGKK